MKISVTQYSKLLYELTQGKSEQEIDKIIFNFIKFLQKNRQMKLISKIIAKFNKIWNKKNGFIEAEITTFRKLENLQIHQIDDFLREKYLVKKVFFKDKINESIKGGIIIKIDDEILDGSLTKRLQKLKSVLVK